jgi:hypothetical protein
MDAPVRPPIGLAFANQRAPLTLDFDETRLGSKHATASVLYVYEPLLTSISLAWGDASLAAAAANGGISKIHYVDYEVLNVLGVFVQFTVHVYGD